MPSSGGQTCALDRKSTRLNSSHDSISYAAFRLKKKKVPTTFSRHVASRRAPPSRGLDSRARCRVPRRARAPRKAARGSHHHLSLFFFFNDTATTEIYPLSLLDALPICRQQGRARRVAARPGGRSPRSRRSRSTTDRKSTRLNSSHGSTSYACLRFN